MFINCMSIALPVRTENRAVGKSSNPNPNPQLCGVLDVWLHLLPHGELWCFLYRYILYIYICFAVDAFVHSWDICPLLCPTWWLQRSLFLGHVSRCTGGTGSVHSVIWFMSESFLCWTTSQYLSADFLSHRPSISETKELCVPTGFFFQIYNRLNLHGAEASGGVLWNTQERRGLIQD